MNQTPLAPREALLDECATIEDNCRYTAQAHFEACSDAGRLAKCLTIGPSIIGGLAGAFVAVGSVPPWLGGDPKWLGIVAAVAAVVTGLASGLSVEAKGIAHRSAANLLTQLRHEARALRESFAPMLSDEQFYADARRLHDRYGMLIQALETTDNKYFERARKRIQAGLFEPDFRQSKRSSALSSTGGSSGAPGLPSAPPGAPGGSSGST